MGAFEARLAAAEKGNYAGVTVGARVETLAEMLKHEGQPEGSEA
ncbi:MAG: hypothetical protein ABSF67_01785 [Roseiarcus sp.]|jgi:hypothetical protein